ncbi:hypothetical protein QE152_g35869 [Popillia japonica]|uniref:Transposase n=1 Tax=Popillia japonica TaxID=7064 RepID=A0AAW1IEE1_POPJA
MRRVIAVDFLTEQRTVNAQYYSNLLKNTVKPAYRSKRRDIPIRSAILLQDNARPHTARLTMEHPPYSPDLSLYDYYLFGPLKKALGGLRFENNANVESVVHEWLRVKPTDFYRKGIRKLSER